MLTYLPLGWHMTLIDYADKIHIILAKMFAILPTIKPENRNAVNDYLQTVYHQVVTLKDGLYECPSNDALRMKFKSYVDSEEERLRLNLKTVDFDIDALDTLALVTGPGRIEKVGVCQHQKRAQKMKHAWIVCPPTHIFAPQASL